MSQRGPEAPALSIFLRRIWVIVIPSCEIIILFSLVLSEVAPGPSALFLLRCIGAISSDS